MATAAIQVTLLWLQWVHSCCCRHRKLDPIWTQLQTLSLSLSLSLSLPLFPVHKWLWGDVYNDADLCRVFIIDQLCLASELFQIYPADPPHTDTVHDEVGGQVHSVGLFLKVHGLWCWPAIGRFVVTQAPRAKLKRQICSG